MNFAKAAALVNRQTLTESVYARILLATENLSGEDKLELAAAMLFSAKRQTKVESVRNRLQDMYASIHHILNQDLGKFD